jgi:hypothetical protein
MGIGRLDIGIVGSIPAQGMHVVIAFMCFVVLCAYRPCDEIIPCTGRPTRNLKKRGPRFSKNRRTKGKVRKEELLRI